MFHLPHLEEKTKHHLFLGAAALVVIVGVLALMRAKGSEAVLGTDPNSLKGYSDKGGGFLSKLFGGKSGGNFGVTLPGLPPPPSDGSGNGDGTGDSFAPSNYVSNTPAPQTQPQNTLSNFVQAVANYVAPPPVEAPAPAATAPGPYDGSNASATAIDLAWGYTPSVDNGLIIPAGTIMPDNAGVSTQDQVLAYTGFGAGNIAQDGAGNYYETSLEPTHVEQYNPFQGHDPSNPNDTN